MKAFRLFQQGAPIVIGLDERGREVCVPDVKQVYVEAESGALKEAIIEADDGKGAINIGREEFDIDWPIVEEITGGFDV